ncbi:MAG: hypothetical protein AAGF47_12965, partial [Planctomycetota bacterium]
TTPPPPPRPADEFTPRPQPARPAQPTRAPQPTRPAEPAFDPTSVEFQPIYITNDDGTIAPPPGISELAAMRSNPLISDDLWPVLEVLLEERYADFNTRVINNPRRAVRIAAGEADNIDVGDRESLQGIAELSGPFDPQGGPITYLANQGVLDENMATMSRHIWRDYSNAMNVQIMEIAGDSDDQNEQLNMQARFLFSEGLGETYAAIDRVFRVVLMDLDSPEAKDAMRLTGGAFRKAAAAVLEDKSDDELAELFTAAAPKL